MGVQIDETREQIIVPKTGKGEKFDAVAQMKKGLPKFIEGLDITAGERFFAQQTLKMTPKYRGPVPNR